MHANRSFRFHQNSSLPSLSTSATTNGIPKLVSGATSSKASANGAHKPFAIPLNGKASSSSNFSSGISFGNGASNGSSVFFPPGITKSSNGTSTYPSSFMQTGLKIYPVRNLRVEKKEEEINPFSTKLYRPRGSYLLLYSRPEVDRGQFNPFLDPRSSHFLKTRA